MTQRTRPEVLAVFLAIFGLFFWFHLQYPFYFMWDMDLTAIQDILLVQSGRLPGHFNHPGSTINLVFEWTQWLAHQFGAVSFLDLKDLQLSGSPITGAAELTDFLRLHSVFVMLGLIYFAWASLSTLFGFSRLGSFLVLLAVGLQAGTFYYGSMVRTDIYSICFWTCALFCGFHALGARRGWRQNGLLILVGLTLGLAYITKIQSLILNAWLVGLLLLRTWTEGGVGEELFRVERIEAKDRLRQRAVGLVIALVFLTLLSLSGAYVLLPDALIIASSYQLNPVGFLAGIGFSLPFLLSLRGFRLRALNLILTGILLSFGIHFLTHLNLSWGWDFMMTNLKVMFFRRDFQSLSGLGLGQFLGRVIEEFLYSPSLFIVHGVVFGIALWTAPTKRVRLLLIGLEAVLFFHLMEGTRYILRDVFWKEFPLVAWNIVLAGSALQFSAVRFSLLRRTFAAVFVALFLLQIGAQIQRLTVMPDQLNAHYNHYGWEPARWKFMSVGGGQVLYQNVMNGKYEAGIDLTPALKQALNWKRWKSDLRFVFMNQALDFRNTSVFVERFKLPGSAGPQLIEVPPSLRGGMVVQPLPQPSRDVVLVRSEVERPSESQQKLRRVGEGEATPFTVLARPDLQVYWFQRAVLEPLPGMSSATSLRAIAQASSGAGPVEYRGYSIGNYLEMGVAALDPQGFFVVADSLI